MRPSNPDLFARNKYQNAIRIRNMKPIRAKFIKCLRNSEFRSEKKGRLFYWPAPCPVRGELRGVLLVGIEIAKP
jgi:hypothetical protein